MPRFFQRAEVPVFPDSGDVRQRCRDSGLREYSLFFATIRPPVKRQEASIEAEPVKNGRSRG